jgi:hypothetical protein
MSQANQEAPGNSYEFAEEARAGALGAVPSPAPQSLAAIVTQATDSDTLAASNVNVGMMGWIKHMMGKNGGTVPEGCETPSEEDLARAEVAREEDHLITWNVRVNDHKVRRLHQGPLSVAAAADAETVRRHVTKFIAKLVMEGRALHAEELERELQLARLQAASAMQHAKEELEARGAVNIKVGKGADGDRPRYKIADPPRLTADDVKGSKSQRAARIEAWIHAHVEYAEATSIPVHKRAQVAASYLDAVPALEYRSRALAQEKKKKGSADFDFLCATLRYVYVPPDQTSRLTWAYFKGPVEEDKFKHLTEVIIRRFEDRHANVQNALGAVLGKAIEHGLEELGKIFVLGSEDDEMLLDDPSLTPKELAKIVLSEVAEAVADYTKAWLMITSFPEEVQDLVGFDTKLQAFETYDEAKTHALAKKAEIDRTLATGIKPEASKVYQVLAGDRERKKPKFECGKGGIGGTAGAGAASAGAGAGAGIASGSGPVTPVKKEQGAKQRDGNEVVTAKGGPHAGRQMTWNEARNQEVCTICMVGPNDPSWDEQRKHVARNCKYNQRNADKNKQ